MRTLAGIESKNNLKWAQKMIKSLAGCKTREGSILVFRTRIQLKTSSARIKLSL